MAFFLGDNIHNAGTNGGASPLAETTVRSLIKYRRVLHEARPLEGSRCLFPRVQPRLILGAADPWAESHRAVAPPQYPHISIDVVYGCSGNRSHGLTHIIWTLKAELWHATWGRRMTSLTRLSDLRNDFPVFAHDQDSSRIVVAGTI